ncbi:hypothetical protein POX_b02640 [Penicillium oxalicum]|uniref:hypothetical protein n=1 Tax=Penicillium oxalicum TaxID=69781 RepID=UPI0020B9012F|nr:hypothetical protein POX_b02640 [Penicillium oxalicum]KAI2792601.1 hypothetical protein POX_b02640 [Penicillium oxalicum]
MTHNRPLLIPHKRPLLPPTTHSTSNSHPVYKTLNPSAKPATTELKSPLSSDEHVHETVALNSASVPRTEYSFAAAPQPFLDPSAWEGMLKRAAMRAQAREAGAPSDAEGHLGGATRSGEAGAGAGETPDQRRRRGEQEAEYGSMAIRGRAIVSGRGKRTRASRGGYWGGRV